MLSEPMMLGHARIIDAESVSDSCFNDFGSSIGTIGKLARTIDAAVQVPFAGLTGDLACISQSLGNGVFAPWVTIVAVVFETEAILIAATH